MDVKDEAKKVVTEVVSNVDRPALVASILKGGFKTSEFWMAVAMIVVGAVAATHGFPQEGLAIMSASALFYKGTRAAVKVAGARIVSAFLVVALLQGCACGVDAKAVGPLEMDVLADYEHYVRQDPDISEAKRHSYLNDVEVLRANFTAAGYVAPVTSN